MVEVYQQIVRPMTKMIKELMFDYKLINEAEMFCTDLEFRADDQGNTTSYIGDLAKKNDDVIKIIQERLRELVSGLGQEEGGFKKKLRELRLEGDGRPEKEIARSKAICVYVATYFRMDERATHTLVQNLQRVYPTATR